MLRSREDRKADRRRIAEAVRQRGGVDVDKVAERFSVSKRHVAACCKEFGVVCYSEIGRPSCHLISKTYVIIAELLWGYFTQVEVAKRNKVSKHRVSKVKKAMELAGVFEASGKRYTIESDEYRIIAEILRGRLDREIANRLSIPVGNIELVRRRLTDHGILSIIQEKVDSKKPIVMDEGFQATEGQMKSLFDD